ncbi:Fe-S cluster assembly protein SufD [Blastopirellula sp. J2-11]|uniref:Fe-S cluster assembly protein SufD n=1 Tax=Blastopirellula sp. J2-11 TaxID=2943192 RepID=UPI0039676A59
MPMGVTAVTDTAKFSASALDELIAKRQEPDWLVDLRRAAFETFCEKALPSRKEEEWMRTDIRTFHLDKFDPPAELTEVPADLPTGLLTEGVDLGGRLVAYNSRTVSSELSEELKAQGVIFGSFSEVLASHPEIVRKHFAQAVDPHFDKFSAMHAAFFTTGQVLYVPRGVVVKKPLHALSLLGAGGVDLGHTLVILEEGAEATMLNETASIDEAAPGLHCGAIELFVHPRARLRYINLQNWGRGVWHFAHQKGVVERDAHIQWTIGALGSKLSKVNQHVALAGVGAESEVNGVMFTEGRQHLSYHTLQHHEAPNCRSNFLYKTALQDRSRTVWRGMIKVDKDAQKTDGYQRNDNLLLTEHCRADSIPGLEIEADDVRCTHGATIGRVDEEQIFYAQCRGFTRKEAIRAIVIGFFQQVFDRIPVESVREALGKAIATRVREYE